MSETYRATSHLNAARAAKRQERDEARARGAHVPEKRTTPGLAIRKLCRSCVYDPKNDGTNIEQVMACTSFACPVWPAREGRPATRWSPKVRESIKLTLDIDDAAVDAWNDDPWTPPEQWRPVVDHVLAMKVREVGLATAGSPVD